MNVEASKFRAGMASAAATVRAFQKSAAVDFKAGNALTKSGLLDIRNGMQAVGILSADAMKLMGGAAAKAGRKAVDSLGPVKDAALASAEALRYTYGGAARVVGGAIGAGLSKVGGPIAAAAKASAASLAYVYGPAIKAIGSGLSSAFSVAMRTMTPMAASLGTIAVGLGKVAGGAALAGRGLLKLSIPVAVQGFTALGAAAGRMVTTVRGAINTLGKFAALSGVVAGYGLAKIVNAAADVTEALNLVQVEFGSASGTVVKEAERMSAAFGVSKREYLDMAGQFAVKFQGLGMNEEQIAKLSNVFAQRAIDVESQRNMRPGEAAERMLSGLSGEMEAVRRLGVNLEEARVKAQAYAMGLGKAGVELTQEEKQHARIALLLAGTAKAAGDRAKTAGEVKNAWREVEGRVVSLAETIGGALEPISRSVIGQMSTALGALQLYWADNQNAVVSWASATVGASGEATQSLGIVQQSVGFIADAWQVVGMTFTAVQSYITSGLANIVGWLGTLNKAMESALNFVGIQAKANNFFETWSEDLKGLSGKQWEEFQTKLAKPPASEGVNAYFDAARAKAEALRAEVLKNPVVNPKVTTGGMPEKHKEVKFAGAHVRGSSDEASTVLRSRYSGGRTADEQKKISANTAKANEHLSKIAAAVVGGQALAFMENF